MRVGLIEYKSAGNLYNVEKALKGAGAQVIRISAPQDLNNVDKLVIPGVGSYQHAITDLKNHSLDSSIRAFKGDILGICIGMQILSDLGYEGGIHEGMSMIRGEVKAIETSLPVPNVGFRNLKHVKKSKLFTGILNEEFYFMHSYEFVNYTDLTSLVEYGNHQIVASVEVDNVYGLQFHPEKSRAAGIKLLENFLDL